MYRTGLAMEAAQMNGSKSGTRVFRRRLGQVTITDVRVSMTDAHRIGKAAGRYITIEGDPSVHAVAMLLCKALEQLLPREGVILASGLGNPDIARDSLGARTIRRLNVGEGCRIAAAMETDVAAKTGIETARLVRGVAKELGATCILAVDALACCDPLKIGRTVQVSDTGIQPGSGVHEDSPALTRSFVGVPVVAVGVPMVSELSGLTGNSVHRGYLAAPVNEDAVAERWAAVIAEAVNGIYRS